MPRNALVSTVLITLVSIPAFLLGEKLRHGDPSVLMLAVLMTMVVLLASAIMRELDRS